MDYNTFQINPRQKIYHAVEFYKVENKPLDSLYCVPASWIKWQDNDSTTVLMVYPDERHDITRIRVENYQSPNENWSLFFAEIIYSSDFYDVMNYIDARVNAKENSAEVSIEIASTQYSVPNSSLSSGEGESAFLMESEEEINRQLNSGTHQLIVNTIDDIMNSKLEVSKFEMDQGDIYEFKEDDHFDQPFMFSRRNENVTSRTLRDLLQGNDLLAAASNSPQTDKKWTLKHKEYSPGLIELMPNTGVYIEVAKLENCLKSSKTCTSLTRQLTANIFTESALKKCINIGPRRGNRENQLNLDAVKAIVNFVKKYEWERKSRRVNIATIESAIRYQMPMYRKK